MQTWLSTPLLSVDAAKIHEVDTTNAQSLRSLWTGECPESLDEGEKSSERLQLRRKGGRKLTCVL
jgi:hypothetical protein